MVETIEEVQALQSQALSSANPIRLLKKGVWLYFLLIIFEGALRKWVLPGLSTPLLLIRDPLAIWLLATAWHRRLLPPSFYLTGMVLIAIVGTFTAVFLGHGNLFVALYGARILAIHFPLIFVIGRVFNRQDVLAMGKVLLWIAIPMTVLITLQFYSPQSTLVNRGVGGNMEGAGFAGALDYFRPSGTFAFTSGVTAFYGLVAPFIIYFGLNPQGVNRLLLLSASVALLAAVPLSISRSLFFQVGLSGVFAIIAITRKPKYLFQTFLVIVAIVVLLVVLNSLSFSHTAIEAFMARFDTAGEQEGGLKGTLGNRAVGSLLDSVLGSADQPFWGYGLGMGTNVGSQLLTGGISYLVAEGEWGRLIGELGPLMGLAVIGIRLALSFKLTVASYHKLVTGDLLPWLFLSVGLITISQAQWAQPTSLGFSTLIGGLMIASLRPASGQDATSINA